ncbi:MAG: hypothetical protein KAI47_04045, partial [Deltaproteobacteria bacterium]|nr:hypothetical protein [Deltaproteobacteria bacterium]
ELLLLLSGRGRQRVFCGGKLLREVVTSSRASGQRPGSALMVTHGALVSLAGGQGLLTMPHAKGVQVVHAALRRSPGRQQ